MEKTDHLGKLKFDIENGPHVNLPHWDNFLSCGDAHLKMFISLFVVGILKGLQRKSESPLMMA